MRQLNLALFLIFCTACNQQTAEIKTVLVHKELPSDLKICVVGDTGRNNEGQALVAKALVQEDCGQVRHLGDVIYPRGLKSIQDKKFESHFLNHYQLLLDAGIPFYINLGNHDYKGSPEIWIELAKNFPTIQFSNYYYLDIYPDICLIALDTNAYFLQQYFWYKEIKRKYFKKCKFKIAFGHHPLFSFGKHKNAALGVHLFLKNTIYGEVDAYLAGHDHDLQDVVIKDGTHYFVSGAGSLTRPIDNKGARWSASKLGYLVLIIKYQENHPYVEFQFKTVSKDSPKAIIEHSGRL